MPSIIYTPLGAIKIYANDKGIYKIELKQSHRQKETYSKRINSLEEKSAHIIARYIEGENVNEEMQKLPLIAKGSDFQMKVWDYIRKEITFGKVKSYLWVSDKLNTSPRAVGNALAHNPIPIIIPCHRVVKSNGHIGGFSAGLNWKKYLLEIEGIKVLNDHVIFPQFR